MSDRASGDSPLVVVLLVDDQPFVGAAIGRLLAAEADIELHCCHDPSRAIATAAAIAPTLILQDLVMPGIDGISLLESFKRQASTASIPVLALSGNDDASTRARALGAGADEYVVKLPSKADLIACIRRHAGGRPQAPPASHGREEIATLDRRVLDAFQQAGLPDPDFINGLIDQFLAEAAGQVARLHDAGQPLDTRTIGLMAHSLKGSAATMGATRLAALCAELEQQTERQPDAVTALASIAAIGEEFVRVREALSGDVPNKGQPASGCI